MMGFATPAMALVSKVDVLPGAISPTSIRVRSINPKGVSTHECRVVPTTLLLLLPVPKRGLLFWATNSSMLLLNTVTVICVCVVQVLQGA
jgi:hypothetical protein